MSNFTPPHHENVVKSGSVLLLALICFCAYFHGYQAGAHRPDEPVSLSRSLFYNPDSIAHYTALAAREDDPRALFIAGMATHLSYADPDYPDSIAVPSLSEADHYLLRAAELGNADAITYIRCLAAHDQWPHFVPDNCK